MNAASSITSKSAVNPRIVGAEHGNPTIVDPFGNRTEWECDPLPDSFWNPNFRRIHLHLSSSSVDCRLDAATTTTLESAFVSIRWTANAATAVLLPHCLAPTKAFRFEGESMNSSCHWSSFSPILSSQNTDASAGTLVAAGGRTSGSTAVDANADPRPFRQACR